MFITLNEKRKSLYTLYYEGSGIVAVQAMSAVLKFSIKTPGYEYPGEKGIPPGNPFLKRKRLYDADVNNVF